MSPGRLLSLPVPGLIIILAIAVSAQIPPGTTSDSAIDPNIFTDQSIIEMVVARRPEEVIITKIQSSKTSFDAPTPALVELDSSWVSANVVTATMTPKNAPPLHLSHKCLTKEST
jgi:hypothetical protein